MCWLLLDVGGGCWLLLMVLCLLDGFHGFADCLLVGLLWCFRVCVAVGGPRAVLCLFIGFRFGGLAVLLV